MRRSILFKILAGIVIPVILCLSILLVTIFNLVQSDVESLTANDLTSKSKQAAYQVEGFFTGYLSMAETLAQNTEIKQFCENTSKGTVITTVQGFSNIKLAMDKVAALDSETILSCWISDIDSSQLTQSDGFTSGPEWDVTTREWYTAIKQQNKTVLTAPYIDSSTGGVIVSTVSPVYDDAGNWIAVVGIDFTLETLGKIMAGYTIGDTGYCVFAASDGTVVYDNVADNIMKSISEIGISENMVKLFTDCQEGYTKYTKDGEEAFGYHSNIGDTGWSVISLMPQAEFYETFNTLRALALSISAVILIVLIVIICAISTGIVRPLKKLARVSHQISEGDLNVSVDIKTKDETGQVAEGLAKTVVRLKDYIIYIDEISEVIDEMAEGNMVFELKQEYIGEFSKIKDALLKIQSTFSRTLSEITVAADQVASGSEQLAGGSQELSQGSLQQASSVEQLSATITEISENIKHNADNAQTAGSISIESAEEVNNGSQQMNEMIGAMEDIKNASNQISNIIKAIDDIAFQTNILALNAAVEAARAGEAGKGFAVVADEVRNLAAKSGEAAKNTTILIETAITAVENGTRIVDATANSLNKIVESTERSKTVINEISDASRLQAESIVQINQGVEQISAVVQTNSATAQQTAAASEELSGQANLLKELVEQFKLQ